VRKRPEPQEGTAEILNEAQKINRSQLLENRSDQQLLLHRKEMRAAFEGQAKSFELEPAIERLRDEVAALDKQIGQLLSTPTFSSVLLGCLLGFLT
jgi:hypothetical protein